MTRVSLDWHPMLAGKSDLHESTLYAIYDNGRVIGGELGREVFTAGQLKAIAEACGWQWHDFEFEVRCRIDDAKAERGSWFPEAAHA
jgi:hypothetical protein